MHLCETPMKLVSLGAAFPKSFCCRGLGLWHIVYCETLWYGITSSEIKILLLVSFHATFIFQ